MPHRPKPPTARVWPSATTPSSACAALAKRLPRLPVEVTCSISTAPHGKNERILALHLPTAGMRRSMRSEEHTSELQSQSNLVCRLLLEKKKTINHAPPRVLTSSEMYA